MKKISVCFFTVLLLVTIGKVEASFIENGSFESGDLSGWNLPSVGSNETSDRGEWQ